jgi:hypothetical protein
VIGEPPARGPGRLRVAENLDDPLRVGEVVELHLIGRHVRQAGAVGQDVLDRDPIDVQEVPLVHEMNDHGGHGLGGREQAEGRIGGGELLRSVFGVRRAVAGDVPDGAIDDHLAAPADAELHSRFHHPAVESLYRLPDAFDPLRRHADAARIDLVGPMRHRCQIAGYGGEV